MKFVPYISLRFNRLLERTSTPPAQRHRSTARGHTVGSIAQ